MKVLITGGTGLIGSVVTKRLISMGHEVVLLTRISSKPKDGLNKPGVSLVKYAYKQESIIPGSLLKDIDGIINMAGEPIFTGRWNAEKMKKIRESRINITRQLVDAISRLNDKKPAVLVNASAVGYYGPSDETELTEERPAGNVFLARVCKQWEEEALRASTLGVRTVVLRTGIVLDKEGGALAKMIPPFKFFMGGPIGTGRQFFSWIHRDDMTELYVSSLMDNGFSGPINATAPNPVTMAELSKTIARILKRPSWLKIPAFLAKLLIGGSAQVVVTGQRVIPARLSGLGFTFKYKNIEEALKACLS